MTARHPFHAEAGSERGTGSEPCSLPAQYAIGPIDPAQLITLQVCVWNSQQIGLLIPIHLPLSLLGEASFKDGCKWGYLACEDKAESGEVWIVPKVLNFIYRGLERELLGERGRDRYTWVVGFLLGFLAGLAETERMLALVGMAHLCFLLACIPLEAWSCAPNVCVRHMEAAHAKAIRTYRARVRLYREQGIRFQEAQCLALAGGVEEVVVRNTSNDGANYERDDR